MSKVNFILLLAIYAGLNLGKGSCKIETTKKNPSWGSESEVPGTQKSSLFTRKNLSFRPHLVETDLINKQPNKTYDFLEFYREMTAIRNNTDIPVKKAYIDKVLVPRTDAKVAKLQAETAYIETKNAGRKKSMNLLVDDFKKSTTFSGLAEKIFNTTSLPINITDELSSIYNETFYYLNNKNSTMEEETNTTNNGDIQFS
ncbi:hypothetical protein FG386_002200 [Cryptosporidium ryanae]|uniref:uncharacterized protein n=1 Tax=Cryptosporidium ryanae TaxID=515981 RepID=UPI00351A7615|nr:hypothetical protein FG386_002200 [Cryptosporidium ryanae]